jgi:hypothetical protein
MAGERRLCARLKASPADRGGPAIERRKRQSIDMLWSPAADGSAA